jgi:hypothetical protein
MSALPAIRLARPASEQQFRAASFNLSRAALTSGSFVENKIKLGVLEQRQLDLLAESVNIGFRN